MAKNIKEKGRLARKARIRKRIEGSTERPRLSIFRSSSYIYAQIIDDVSQKTLATCSSSEKSFRSKLKSLRQRLQLRWAKNWRLELRPKKLRQWFLIEMDTYTMDELRLWQTVPVKLDLNFRKRVR